MDWLKEILEKASITEEGKIDVDALIKAINVEFPRHAVPKDTFNSKAEELKSANAMIEELKKSNSDNEELQTKIKSYEAEIEELKTTELNNQKTYALRDKLKEAGITDADYVIYKQGGIDKFNFDKEGKPIGVEDIIKPLKESSPHLFNQSFGGYEPTKGASPTAKNPFAKDSFNMTEQGKLLKEDPARARELAGLAGVKI